MYSRIDLSLPLGRRGHAQSTPHNVCTVTHTQQMSQSIVCMYIAMNLTIQSMDNVSKLYVLSAKCTPACRAIVVDSMCTSLVPRLLPGPPNAIIPNMTFDLLLLLFGRVKGNTWNYYCVGREEPGNKATYMYEPASLLTNSRPHTVSQPAWACGSQPSKSWTPHQTKCIPLPHQRSS